MAISMWTVTHTTRWVEIESDIRHISQRIARAIRADCQF